MSIGARPDWWKTMFDDVYLLTDARSVCDDSITRREVDMICELIPIAAGHRILDLCGGHGRHSLELCARGFSACTLVDYSKYLLDCAARHAAGCNYTIDVVLSDARDTSFPRESFDHVLIMGNSMGYIQMEAADDRILSEVYRVLRPGGWVLVDVTDGKAVKAGFTPNAWHEIGTDTVVCRQRKLRGDKITARELVLSKQNGIIRDRNYTVRLYERQTLEMLFNRSGFEQVTVRTGFSPHNSPGDFGFMNHRMIATGRKGK